LEYSYIIYRDWQVALKPRTLTQTNLWECDLRGGGVCEIGHPKRTIERNENGRESSEVSLRGRLRIGGLTLEGVGES